MSATDDNNATSPGPRIREYCARIPESAAGIRVDRALTALFSEFSRAAIQRWIRAGALTLDGNPVRGAQRAAGGERVRLNVTETEDQRWMAETGAVHIRYQDEDLLVLDKPAGLVVHPGAGNANGTLINRLLAQQPKLRTLPRCGIVHRLDKDTSGLLIVAISARAYTALCSALEQHRVRREYLAIADGIVASEQTVDAPIGRDPYHRTRMAVVSNGRQAITHIRIREHFRAQSLLWVQLGTGRTHQIRVHLAHIGHPLLGDSVYNRRENSKQGSDATSEQRIKACNRQALHATALGFNHPVNGDSLHFTSPLPLDMVDLINALSLDRDRGTSKKPNGMGGWGKG